MRNRRTSRFQGARRQDYFDDFNVAIFDTPNGVLAQILVEKDKFVAFLSMDGRSPSSSNY